MIMPDDCGLPLAAGAMGGDQHSRVNLKPARRVIGHIGRRANRADPALPVIEQQPANLAIRISRRQAQNAVECSS